MRKRDFVSGAVFLALGIATVFAIAGIPDRSLPNTPGPSFFPWIITVAIIGLSVALIVRSFVPTSTDTDEDAGGDNSATRGRVLAIVAVLAGFVAYIALLPSLGFLIATVPFFGGLMLLYGERRPLVVVAGSIVATVGLYVVFRHAFQIFLPQGLLLGIVP